MDTTRQRVEGTPFEEVFEDGVFRYVDMAPGFGHLGKLMFEGKEGYTYRERVRSGRFRGDMTDSKSAPVHPLEIGLPGEKDIYGI